MFDLGILLSIRHGIRLFLILMVLGPPAFAQSTDKALNRAGIYTADRPTGYRRVALVIGNSAYSHAPPLKAPAGDAVAMADKLKALGFEVRLATNTSEEQLEDAVRAFADEDVPGSRIALVYYSGHGVQRNGVNYMVPVDADIRSSLDVAEESVPLDQVLARLGTEADRLNFVLWDACRNDPFPTAQKGAPQGPARMESVPSGTLLFFGTMPGQVARDGESGRSPFTAALLEELGNPGQEVQDLIRAVGDTVKRETQGAQEPWQEGMIYGLYWPVPEPCLLLVRSTWGGPLFVDGEDLGRLSAGETRGYHLLGAGDRWISHGSDVRPFACVPGREVDLELIGVLPQGQLQVRAVLPDGRPQTAIVYLDGERAGVTPYNTSLVPGTYEVRVRSVTRATSVLPDQEQTMELVLPEVRGRGLVAGGAALFVLGAGVGAGTWLRVDPRGWTESPSYFTPRSQSALVVGNVAGWSLAGAGLALAGRGVMVRADLSDSRAPHLGTSLQWSLR